MSVDYVDARERLARLDRKLCLFVGIPVPPGAIEDVQRAFTGVLFEVARHYRARVDEVRRVSDTHEVEAAANRVLFFRAHRRSGWYAGKDAQGRRGFWKMLFHDRAGRQSSGPDEGGGLADDVACGQVDEDDRIRWKRTAEDGERYLSVSVMKCIGVDVGGRRDFSGLLIVEDQHPRLQEKLQRVARTIQELRPEVTIEIRPGRA
ncbi:MAG: hypothetical protein HZA54_09850 [Planctomycetes bacterium]|nr:hypothetical protein [Planctomycetota bacterium]